MFNVYVCSTFYDFSVSKYTIFVDLKKIIRSRVGN